VFHLLRPTGLAEQYEEGHDMTRLGEILRRLSTLFRRGRFQRDLSDEIRHHLDLKTRSGLEIGMPAEEARRAAEREFGNSLLLRERGRDAWGWVWIDRLGQDLRYGWRQLLRSPGFTGVALLTLALGIGVNTTVFSVVSSMLLGNPPVADPARLMMLLSRNPGPLGDPSEAGRWPVSAPDFVDWRAQATSFSSVAASTFDDVSLSGGDQPERVPGGRVSANYFEILGVAPLLGRTFTPGEDQSAHTRGVVLGEALWKRRFNADPGVVGRTVKVDGDTYTVIGVMPDVLRRLWLFPAELWTPLVFTPEELAPSARGARSLSVLGRLKPEATESAALAELGTIARRVAAANPATDKGWGANVIPLQDFLVQESHTETALMFLLGTVGFVLLIACANLANLMLARNANRRREFAVRTALGAGRFRLARQVLCECLMLAIAGGALGLLLAVWGVRLVRASLNWNEYSALLAEGISIDLRVLAFTIAASVAAALLFGLAPALFAAQRDPGASLKENSRSTTAGREHHRLQNLLVMGQLALSIVLLVGAGLFVKSFIDEIHLPRGMNTDGILTASVSLSGPAYQGPDERSAFYQSVLRRLASYPQVEAEAVTSDLPFTFPASTRFTIEGRPPAKPGEEPSAGYFAVSPGYFAAMQIQLRAGREFTPSDRARSAPVVIVDEAFAQRYFPNRNPIGGHVSIRREAHEGIGWNAAVIPSPASTEWSEIVGVVSDVDEYGGELVPRPHLFEPFLERPPATMNVVVRTRTDPRAFADSLRRSIWSVDRDQPVTNLRTMDRIVLDSEQGDDLMAGLMATFAAIALAIAAVGIYGLMAYLVGRRTHELGVRMALGARRGEILRLVLRDSLSKALAGVGIGFLISLGVPVLLKASFQGYHVRSAWILTLTPLAVILVTLASCYFPARRASRVDPTEALRCE